MIVLGLTGSIGMGKTTAARAFRHFGVATYDADAAVHRLLGAGGAAVGAVLRLFPDVAIDGDPRHGIDRRVLGARVFGDNAALARLEALLHPRVRAEERHFLEARQRHGDHLVVLDIPLLFETGGERRCDVTAVVSAPSFVQRARVMRRAGMTEDRLAAILARQMPDREKRRRADFVIPTGLDRRLARHRVHRIINRLSGRRGTHWPAAWAAALRPQQRGGSHA